MILTDFYKLEKLPNQKAKSRIDCTASTGSYNPLELFRNKADDLFLYIGGNTYTKAGKQRKSDLVLSKSIHISSIYNPDIELPYWYGDMKGTSDAFLFIHHNVKFIDGRIQDGAIIELFVARGQKNNRTQLYNAFCDGELDGEIELLRKQITKPVITNVGKQPPLY